MLLKKAWLTEAGGELFSLSLESQDPEREHMRVHARDLLFPILPTKDKPLRHTTVIGLFDFEDLRKLRNAINDLLGQYGEDDG